MANGRQRPEYIAILEPPQLKSSERDFARLLIRAVRLWGRDVMSVARAALTTFQDNWIDDLGGRVRGLWDQYEQDLTNLRTGGIQAEQTARQQLMRDGSDFMRSRDQDLFQRLERLRNRRQSSDRLTGLTQQYERDLQNSPISRVLQRASNRQRDWWAEAVSRLTGTPVDAVRPRLTQTQQAEVLQARLLESAHLVRDIGDQAAGQLVDIVRSGVRSGRSADEITQDIQRLLNTTEGRARNIAVDQIGTYQADLLQVQHRDAGIDWYTWRSREDSKVRPLHRAYNRNRFRYSSPPADGNPGEPVKCRCWAEPVLPASIHGLPVRAQFLNAQAEALQAMQSELTEMRALLERMNADN